MYSLIKKLKEKTYSNEQIAKLFGSPSKIAQYFTLFHSANVLNLNQRLELAKKISPRTSLIYFNSAIIYYSAGETKKALLEVDKAIEIDPFNPKQYEFKYKLEKLLGDKSGARRDKRKYKELIRRSA